MKTKFFLPSAVFCAVFSGCFSHQEAPERPETALSVDEALTRRESVQRVILNDLTLGEIPAELASMPHLGILYLRNTGITNFTGLASLVKIREIDLSGIQMAAAPEELEALPELTRLYLSGCSLTAFPKAVEKSASLNYLNLDRNKIETLPETLPASLRWLRLNANSLTALPDAVGSLTDLRRIYLKGNGLSALPDTMASLTRLEDINLAYNKFTAFPEVLIKLPALRNLDLRGNTAISSLPVKEGDMPALRTLTLTGCPLSKEERARVSAALPNCVINF